MRIYIAAAYTQRLEMARVKFDLLLDGHACTSRWIDGTHPYGSNPQEAQNDLDDVEAADVLVLFTAGDSPGGRYVELGAALAWEKMVYVVGPHGNLFTRLAVKQFDKWDDCRQFIYMYAHQWAGEEL